MDIWQLEDLHGGRRHHLPGKHPVTARLQGQLSEVERYGDGGGEVAAYMRSQIALFEGALSEYKAADWLALRSRTSHK